MSVCKGQGVCAGYKLYLNLEFQWVPGDCLQSHETNIGIGGGGLNSSWYLDKMWITNVAKGKKLYSPIKFPLSRYVLSQRPLLINPI